MSTSRRKKNTLLILSGILLCLVLWISNILWRENIKRVSTLPAPAMSITISQNNAVTIEFVQRNNQWLMLSPEEHPVLPERLEPIMRMAVIPADNSYAASEVDLVAAGLVKPLAKITIDGTTISLGEKDTSGERRYAMQLESVYFVPEWTLSLIQGGPSAFIATPKSQ